MKRLPPDEKETEVGINLQQPQMDDRAAQPEQLFEGEISSGAAELQEKMEAAAKEFCEILTNKWCLWWDLDHIPRDLYLFKELSPYVRCTQMGVFYPYGGQWIRMTKENMVDPQALEEVHKAFKKHGDVSWTLPKLQKEGGELV